MTSLASTTQLAAVTGKTYDQSRAQMALDAASAEIRGYCGWTISAETDIQADLDVSCTRRVLLLPSLMVTAVTSVTEDGTVLATTDYSWSSAGMLRRESGCWTEGYGKVSVVFSHGYATVPDDVVQVCCRLAADDLADPTGRRRSVRLGSMQIDYATGQPQSDPNTVTLDRYRIARSR